MELCTREAKWIGHWKALIFAIGCRQLTVVFSSAKQGGKSLLPGLGGKAESLSLSRADQS